MQPSEKSSAEARYVAPRAAEPSFTADGFLALHATLFESSAGIVGQIRHAALSWNERHFAHVPMIISSLEQHFANLVKVGDLKALSRDAFFDRLAYHVSELHAISPFRVGNRRTLARHAEQLAHAVGYAVQTSGHSKNIWDEVLTLSFVHKDHRGIANLLKGVAIPVDFFPDSIIGTSGLPQLPDRDASLGRDALLARRYQRPIARAKREVEDYLPEAQDQAMAAVIKLTNDAASSRSQLTPALQVLAYLRHPNGPIFQAAMLDAINFGAITPAISAEDSALERVREIGTAISVGIAQQTRGSLEFLIETVRVPEYSVRGSPHQDRLAAQFLSNTAEQNHADPRLAACQRAVDDISAKAKRNRTSNPKRVAAKIDQTRREIAARIRSGDMMVADVRTDSNARFASVG